MHKSEISLSFLRTVPACASAMARVLKIEMEVVFFNCRTLRRLRDFGVFADIEINEPVVERKFDGGASFIGNSNLQAELGDFVEGFCHIVQTFRRLGCEFHIGFIKNLSVVFREDNFFAFRFHREKIMVVLLFNYKSSPKS